MDFWPSLIITLVGTCLGGAIAAWIGYSTQRKIEAQKEKAQQSINIKKLHNYLVVFRNEIQDNIEFIDSILEEPPSLSLSEELIPTNMKDAYLTNLGVIPLPQVANAIESLNQAYVSFEKINRLWKIIYVQLTPGKITLGGSLDQVTNQGISKNLGHAKTALKKINQLIKKIETG